MGITERINTEKNNLKSSVQVPVFFLGVMWVIRIFEFLFRYDLRHWGIMPRKLDSLHGILTSVLIHGGFRHLMANSIPFLVLSTALFYFYKHISYRIFFLSYIISGAMLWVVGRTAWHIGASGLIYALASFLFFGGVFKRHPKLIIISILIVIFYGGLIWGIFPGSFMVSWEGHLCGAVTGMLLAYSFKDKGLVKADLEGE
ncbi:MAG: rhomboid family intramembrane serine protease [Marinifilaceae bacterium]|jgi:membrane associated rhomboid family serine protease|nr:rhomboid family intramembrane serine protease [Marinifilaceae bacterium]